LSWVRLRKTPGYVNKPDDDVVAEILPGTAITLLEGPTARDDLVWWRVRSATGAQGSVVGWLAETAPGGVVLIGLSVAQKPAEFDRGQLVTVGNSSTRVRRAAGYVNKPAHDVLGELYPRVTVVVLGGPVQADSLYWWRIGGISTTSPVLGWVAQRAPSGEELLRLPPLLPGTRIPNAQTREYLATPFVGQYGISQLWGENPSFYGRYRYDGVPLRGHNGIDYFTPEGTDLLATDSGQVVMAGFEPDGFGFYILLAHAWGQSIYAHLSLIAVQQGQEVARGSFIGKSGNTGGSTGPHLHFAIRIHPYSRPDGWGGYSDPLPYLDPTGIFLPPYVLDVGARQGIVPPNAVHMIQDWEPPRMAEDRPGVIRP
jgi:murein DD-endopeptidase MepM/ murein hydrolase activator NlpD